MKSAACALVPWLSRACKITKAGKGKMSEFLSGNELARMILDLRAKGWTDTEIIEHILTIIG